MLNFGLIKGCKNWSKFYVIDELFDDSISKDIIWYQLRQLSNSTTFNEDIVEIIQLHCIFPIPEITLYFFQIFLCLSFFKLFSIFFYIIIRFTALNAICAIFLHPEVFTNIHSVQNAKIREIFGRIFCEKEKTQIWLIEFSCVVCSTYFSIIR